MRRSLEYFALAVVLALGAVDAVPDRVAWFGFGLLCTHWISGALAGLRDALVLAARKPPEPFIPDWDTCPSKPIFGEPGYEDETASGFEYRLAHYDALRDAWVLGEARRMVTSR